jgi:hypothetical protein
MRRRLPLACGLVLVAAIAACSLPPRLVRVVTPPEAVATLDKRSAYLKAHMRDGSVYVLTDWSVDEAAGSLSGKGELLGPDRRVRETGELTLAIASVALFETNVLQKSPSVRALSVMTGVSVAATVYCIANPKACFGSCPTFYVSDGARDVLMAEGFSASVAPSLEATDLDALPRARPVGRDLHVRMKNEALETHVVRYVDVLAAPRLVAGRVFATQAGELWQAAEVRQPVACVAAEGDCRAAVLAFDGRERTSVADGRDLGARETIDLEFVAPLPGQRVGLVVASRQTLVSTFLFYQELAYMGRSAGAWLAALEREGGSDVLAGMLHAVGGIEVLVEEGAGRWRSLGELYETGPLAADARLVLLPSSVPQALHVRLRLARGHWRLDYVALASLGARVEPVRIAPEGGRQALTTLPGDVHDFDFRLPEDPERYELFLETRGYYLEWMRDEWLVDEDPARAAMMLADPKRALRVLAPEFKKREAEMDRLFWNSRYARP